ncbi:MAG: PA14 domain-containing protein [Bacteroidia bacterium]|nr:PA14 domain-containing protein [Bacteroidia bacterium]
MKNFIPKHSKYLLLSLLLAGLYSCFQPATQHSHTRASDPWVFRSVLDEKARMITLALDSNLWVAYDAQYASLYRAWKGGVDLDGAVYTYRHGPQPTSLGNPYFQGKEQQAWKIRANGQMITPEVSYKGHRFEHGGVILSYDISHNGHKIHIEEHPEYIRTANGDHGFERNFHIEGVPEGSELILLSNLESVSMNGIQTDAHFETDQQSESIIPGEHVFSYEGKLVLGNGHSYFKVWLIDEPVQDAAVAMETEEIHPGLALIDQSDCRSCHNPNVKTIGPAYVEIAKKYPTNGQSVQSLARKVINGGSGVWGETMMTPHPQLDYKDVRSMISYILTLDGEPPYLGESGLPNSDITISDDPLSTPENQGLIASVYLFEEGPDAIPEFDPNDQAAASVIVPLVYATEDEHFRELKNAHHFYIRFSGFIDIPEDSKYDFRLSSDDGSRLMIDDKVVVDHDGLHGPDAKDGEVILSAGKHKFILDYIENSGGKAVLLEWLKRGNDEFTVVPPSAFTYDPDVFTELLPPEITEVASTPQGTPGDGYPVAGVHPSFDLETVRPDNFKPKVGGLDFLDERGDKLLVSTWDPEGSVYMLEGVQSGNPENVTVTRIAKGLAEPLGLKVVDGDIYVLQKQELTQLIDHDGDMIIDEYKTVSNEWKVSANFHEFAFGLAYQDDHFYFTLATAILPGGASANPQIPDRGKAVKVNRTTGELTFIAHGLRTPNGIGEGVKEQLFIADNQGDWLPASKIVHVKDGAWYGSRSVDFAGTANLTETLPVVWLPQDEIGNSPSQPAYLNVGPYKGQMIHGEVTHGGIKRVYVEEVEGQLQGCLFRFSQGIEAGVNRLIWGPDGSLYIGGVGNPGNWSHQGGNWYGLQRMTYNEKTAFEMLKVSAKPNGMEIEFTEALPEAMAKDPTSWNIQQWFYLPTANYGGPKMNEEQLNVNTIELSSDRKRVFLGLDGMKEGHVVYINIHAPFKSDSGQSLWSTEAWYTLNKIPASLGAGMISSVK